MEIQALGEQVHSIRLGDLANFRYYMQLHIRNCVYFLFRFDLFSLEALHHDHMKPRLLVLVGLAHPVEIIVKLERLGTVLPMVALLPALSKK